MKSDNYIKQILDLITKLHKEYPTFPISRHISTAFAEYRDIWGISNKEFLFALNKYYSQLETGFLPESEENIDQIIKEGTTGLFNLNEEDEDEF